MRDRVDQILDQWAEARPDLDASALGVVGRILRLAKHMRRNMKEALAPYGLDLWGFDVLAALRRAGPPYSMSPTELRRVVMLTSGAMTNRVDRLEERGWVERVADHSDRRAIQVRLTERGEELIDDAAVARMEMAQDLLEPLAADDRLRLADLLRTLLLSRDGEAEPQRFRAARASRAPSFN
jgi:DNA-binding MarR family transcriptional regulator